MIRQCLLKRATTKNNDRPDTACRPFDTDASGSVFGEAAGAIVLERAEHARRRNAKSIAGIVGIGQSTNLHRDYKNLEKDGKGIRIAIEKAMTDAGISARELDLLIPHGTAIADDDRAEATAIEAALGSEAKRIPAWPIKSMLSNTGAASGALDVIAAVCAMKEGRIPAAKNCDKKADGCNLNIITEPWEKNIRYALCCGYTYGGQTAALVLKNLNGETS